MCRHHKRLLTNQKTTGIDPTRTKTLRNKFTAEMFKRFNALKGAVNTSLIENDALTLKTNAPLPPNAFAFKTLDEKHALFMVWIKEQVDEGILEIIRREGVLLPRSGRPWTDIFLASAYQKGILRGRQELRKQGVVVAEFAGVPLGTTTGIGLAFNQPVHAQRSALIFARAFSELEGITAAMDASISRVLAQGMIEGQSPVTIAREINKQIDNIGLMRAKRLARTEVIRAHHLANVAELRLSGVEGIEVVAEFLTAGDSLVCIRCARLAGRRFEIDDPILDGLIPVHPNCRCVVIPIVEDNIRDQKPLQSPKQIKKIAGL